MSGLDYDPPQWEVVTKLDAARRQIETAISIWFNEGDSIAVHTLTAASHAIVSDICRHRKLPLPIISDTTYVKKGMEKEYYRLVRKADNFFKHADKDPGSEIKFNAEATEVLLLDAIEGFHKCNGKSTPLMMAFRFRFFLFHPDVFTTDMIPEVGEPLRIQFRTITKRQFADTFLKAFKSFRRKRSG